MTRSDRSFPVKKLALALAGIAAGLLTLYLINLWLNVSSPGSEPEQPTAATGQPSPDQPDTIATAWQWQEDAPQQQREQPTRNDIPFSAEGIYTALQEVRIDRNGNVVLDNRALEALQQALDYGNVDLGGQDLADLQELIQVGLPGKAGEQTARIVVDFYHYMEAEKTLNSMLAPSLSAYSGDEAFQHQHEELQVLREQYLGQEVAEALFATADATANYMFAARQIQEDDSLSHEEKARKSAELHEQLQRDIIPIDNWETRRQEFQADKQRILDAGLAEQEKQSQIEALMQQHFEPEEREQIRHLQIDQF
ncbi:MAG: hypothetical protein EA349_12090 [Halomonadaceae bacterium]|nr:MAG: hypothetical protein EA349_12090 [Halomonadaceae bacterium]